MELCLTCTLKSIANNEPPDEEVLFDRPEEDNGVTRVTGPFVVEASLPTPQSLDGADEAIPDDPGDHIARMIEVLRKSPTYCAALPGQPSHHPEVNPPPGTHPIALC